MLRSFLSIFLLCFSTLCLAEQSDVKCVSVEKMENLKFKHIIKSMYAFEKNDFFEYVYFLGKVDAIDECIRLAD